MEETELDEDKLTSRTRPIISILLIATLCTVTLVVVSKISITTELFMAVFTAMVGLATAVVKDWFNDRGNDKARSQMLEQIKEIKGTGNGGTKP